MRKLCKPLDKVLIVTSLFSKTHIEPLTQPQLQTTAVISRLLARARAQAAFAVLPTERPQFTAFMVRLQVRLPVREVFLVKRLALLARFTAFTAQPLPQMDMEFMALLLLA